MSDTPFSVEVLLRIDHDRCLHTQTPSTSTRLHHQYLHIPQMAKSKRSQLHVGRHLLAEAAHRTSHSGIGVGWIEPDSAFSQAANDATHEGVLEVARGKKEEGGESAEGFGVVTKMAH